MKTSSFIPSFAGSGIGKALLQQVAAVAVEKNCPRLQWEVLDWNTPAIDFYRAMGAEFLDEWRNVRVSGEALQRLAGAAPTSAPAGALPSSHLSGDGTEMKEPADQSYNPPKSAFPAASAGRRSDKSFTVRKTRSSLSEKETAQ